MNDFDQGVTHYSNKNYNEAKDCFLRVLSQDPYNIVAHHNIGVICIHLEQNLEAVEYFNYSCNANYIESFISRGAAFRNLGRYYEALKDFGTAFTLDPNHSTAYSNYSNILRELGYNERALDFIKIANKIKPDHTSLLNESITYLALGDFTNGWEKYQYRWFYETGSSLKPNLPGPEFDGTQPLENKIVLVYHEQGFGDCIQFARYLNVLEQEKAHVVLLSKPKLISLMAHNYPNIKVHGLNENIPGYHYHVALLDLPKCFKTTIDTIPRPTAYLSVDEGLKTKWRNILGSKSKLRIGLTWTSNGAAYNTKFRKIELSELLNVVSEDFEFVNLHYDPTEEETQLLEKFNIKNFNQELGDFYSTAGLISNLDCVISVDTATAHLSASLGIPTFIILPNYGCDWRWFQNRSDSPFYSCVKLFRKEGNDLTSVIDSLKTSIKNLG